MLRVRKLLQAPFSMQDNLDPACTLERGKVLDKECTQRALEIIFQIMEGEVEGYVWRGTIGSPGPATEDVCQAAPHLSAIMQNIANSVGRCLHSCYEETGEGYLFNPGGGIPNEGIMNHPDLQLDKYEGENDE